MKKIKILILSILLNAVFLNANDSDSFLSDNRTMQAYRLGGFHIISELNRNIRQQGHVETTIKFKNYMVVKKLSKEQSTVDLLLLQRLSYSEGLTPVFTKKYFVFGSFDRKADAKFLQNDILKKSYFKNDEKSIIIKDNSKNEVYKKEAFLYKELYNKIMQEIKETYEGNVVVIEKKVAIKEIKKQQLEPKEIKAKPKKVVKNNIPKTKYFKFKRELKHVVLYKNKKGVPSVKNLYSITDMYEGKTIKNKRWKRKFKNVATTDVGTKFIKLLNQIYFVDISDVEIIK